MKFASRSVESGQTTSVESGGSFWSGLESSCEDVAIEVTIDSVRRSKAARRETIPGLKWIGCVAMLQVDDLRVPREYVQKICGFERELDLLRAIQATRRLIAEHA